MLTWNWRTFKELNTNELYDLLALRQEVFTVEQQCTENDLDYQDQAAFHLLGLKNNKLMAYLRLFLAGTKYPDAACFGRVLTEKSMRGKGIARQMMDQTLLLLQQHHNTSPIIISAQKYLEKFYQSYGFQTIGTPYNEAGIEHIKMIKPHA